MQGMLIFAGFVFGIVFVAVQRYYQKKRLKRLFAIRDEGDAERARYLQDLQAIDAKLPSRPLELMTEADKAQVRRCYDERIERMTAYSNFQLAQIAELNQMMGRKPDDGVTNI